MFKPGDHEQPRLIGEVRPKAHPRSETPQRASLVYTLASLSNIRHGNQFLPVANTPAY